MGIPRPLLRVLRSTPVLNCVSAASSAHPRILMWHRFGPETTARAVGVELFDAQMALLRARFELVNASELCQARSEGRLRRNTVAVTIDDGYEDFLYFALPVLTKYRIPATLYATTAFVDQRLWLWPDFLRYAIEHTSRDAIECGLGGQSRAIDLRTPAARERAWHTLADHALTLTTSEAQQFIRTIVAELKTRMPDTPTAPFRALTWAQLREVAKAGIEIGGHSCTHPLLTRCTEAQITSEVTGCKHELENQLQVDVTSFAYPHGICDETVRRLVQSAGYRNAYSGTATDYRIHDAFDIKRCGGGDDLVSFRYAAYGVHFAAGQCGIQI
jgi:peptidoglycan/xylan/chitin deacetylase (PgdA/CDA1 family)